MGRPSTLYLIDHPGFSLAQSLIIQLGVKECIVVESQDTKNARATTSRKRKSIAIDVDDNEAESMDVDPPTKASKGKGKDDHDIAKLLGMIERCGVVITEVTSCKFCYSGWPLRSYGH